MNYHASSDTYDKVDFEQLKINEAMAAELVVELANAPGGSVRATLASKSKRRFRKPISTTR